MFTLLVMLQSVTTLQSSADLAQIILGAASLIVVGAMAWVIKVTRDVKIAITRLTDCLFGYTGTNGLNADVTRLRADVNELLRR